jgi:SpoVK/Ycf46/Vps4 family AAA+-type ATPase
MVSKNLNESARSSEEMISSPTTQLPGWFVDHYIPTFSSGAAHCFLMSGDIYGATVQGISQVRFLQTVLAQRRSVVAYYNRATGIAFLTESMQEAALQLIGRNELGPVQTDPMASVLAASGIGAQPTEMTGDAFRAARNPLSALSLLERLLRAPEGKEQVAVILDFADTLCPQMDKAAMSADDRLLLVTLLSWGQDAGLAQCDNPVFLLTRQASELHTDLRASSSGYKLIEIPLPTREERATYLRWYLKQRQEQNKPLSLLENLTIQELANLTAGLNLRQIEDILLLAAKAGITRSLVKARKDSIIAAEYSQIAEMIDPLPGGFSAIGGMERLTAWFRNELITPIAQGRTDIPKGVLLVGPPGTGKSFLVRALAREIGFNAVALKAENILGSRVGDSERQFRQFRQFCEGLAPVAVFFDELDQSDMSRRGNGSGNPVAANLFSAMLQWMSDETLRGKVIIFFASNRPDLVDPALLRLGRMDAIIPVLLPDEEARRGILRAQARNQAITVGSEVITALASNTKDYSAADLAAIMTKARKCALREKRTRITVADAQAALRSLRPQTPQIAKRYTLLAVQACNDAELLPPPYDQMLSDRENLQTRLEATPTPLPARGERNW